MGQQQLAAGLILKNQAEAARLFGVQRSTIHDWVAKGFPVRKDGTISAPAALAWLTCFGPERTEAARDEALRRYIERLA